MIDLPRKYAHANQNLITWDSPIVLQEKPHPNTFYLVMIGGSNQPPHQCRFQSPALPWTTYRIKYVPNDELLIRNISPERMVYENGKPRFDPVPQTEQKTLSKLLSGEDVERLVASSKRGTQFPREGTMQVYKNEEALVEDLARLSMRYFAPTGSSVRSIHQS